MLEIKEYDKIINSDSKEYDEASFNDVLYWAYKNSKDADNEMLDFNYVIWEQDIANIAFLLRKFGISEFTISSKFSGLIEILAVFNEKDIIMQGIVQVNDLNRKKIPAILMKII